MAHKVIDRCKETTSTTGTGNLTLTGAMPGFVSVASGLAANGDTGWFCAEAGTQWEVFLGTRVSATVLARTTVISSSNGGAAVNFTSPPVVFSTVPGAKLDQVAFRMSRTSNQSLSNSTETTITFNQADVAIGGGANAAAGTFTVPVSGIYEFLWTAGASGSNGGFFSTWMEVNGAAVATGSQQVWAAGIAVYSLGHDLRELNAGDVVRVRCYASGTGLTLSGLAARSTTYFCGKRLICA